MHSAAPVIVAGRQGVPSQRNRRGKQAWAWFAVKAVGAAFLVLCLVSYIGQRFRVGIDTQVSQCLPGTRVFLIDTFDRTPVRGEAIAFRSLGLSPFFADGTLIVKIVDGVPGDEVAVSSEATKVNGSTVGTGLTLAAQLGSEAARFHRNVTVPPDQYWVMGRTSDAFDSRYWGPVKGSQIAGRVYRLF